MRRVLFVRHGQPAFPEGRRCCLGVTDLPLSALGRLQACLLGEALREEGLTVFSSPLRRAAETAGFLAPAPLVLPGLREYAMGDWDGLGFDEIRARWPELYAARGENPRLPMPNAEPFEDGQRRFAAAMEEALRESEGDIAVVSHTAVIQSWLCLMLGSRDYDGFAWRLPYGGVLEAALEGGRLVPHFPARSPRPVLTEKLCLALLDAAGLPAHTVEHCQAVAAEALRIADALCTAGHALNRDLIFHAALLHDLARAEKDHAAVGAAWLEQLGYPEIAAIVRRHHDPESEEIDESAVVYLADKCVQGAERVSLAVRFEASQKKCRSPEALAAHERRRRQAVRMAAALNTACGQEVVK